MKVTNQRFQKKGEKYSKLFMNLDDEELKLLKSIKWFWYHNTISQLSKRTGFGRSLTKYLLKRLLRFNFIKLSEKNNCWFPKYQFHPDFEEYIKHLKLKVNKKK